MNEKKTIVIIGIIMTILTLTSLTIYNTTDIRHITLFILASPLTVLISIAILIGGYIDYKKQVK